MPPRADCNKSITSFHSTAVHSLRKPTLSHSFFSMSAFLAFFYYLLDGKRVKKQLDICGISVLITEQPAFFFCVVHHHGRYRGVHIHHEKIFFYI